MVNGWMVPVTGTKVGTPPGTPNNIDTWSKITLDPPPANSGDHRADFVFLEVWQARIPSNPSTLNKPTSSAIFRYGNVEGGSSYIADDLKDPAIGFETTQRIQLQYRIRVVKGLIGLSTFPDGFDPSSVKGQGTQSSAPTVGFSFTNMKEELGDPGLWRAGDGTANSLGTVDGYVYAIPICIVFRRNSVVWAGDPSQNLNGAFNRNPIAIDRTGVKTFSTVPTLSSALSASATTLTLVSATDIPLPASPATAVLIQIGDELVSYTSISGNTVSGLVRGKNGTVAETHPAGTTIQVHSGRPDGLFSDQVSLTDIYDLRHVVNPNGFDYNALLQQNLGNLLKGNLRGNWKRAGSGVQGTNILYEDRISSSSAGLGITKLDAPDRIRLIYSDAAVQQPVEVLCTPYAGIVTAGEQPVASNWALNVVSAVTTRQAVGDTWTSDSSDPGVGTDPTTRTIGDRIKIPVSAFKNSVPGGDSDQVRLLNEVIHSSLGTSAGTTSFSVSGVDFTDLVTSGDTLVIYYGDAKGTYQILSGANTILTVDRVIPSTSGAFYEIRKGSGSVQIRIDGASEPLPQHRFVVTPPNPTTTDNLIIQFVGVGNPFPISKVSNPNLYVTLNIQYGGGRGLARRPDRLHNVTLYNPNSELLTQPSGVPQTNFPLRTSWAMLWSKYRSSTYKRAIPVTTEAYADLGSKTVIVTPYQRISFPTSITALNGSGSNPYSTPVTTGTSSTMSGSTLTDSTKNFTVLGVVAENSLLVIHEGEARGSYLIRTVGATTLESYTAFPSGLGDNTVSYSVYHTQGLMPLNKADGVTAKWATTDPLGLFSGSTDASASRKNFCVTVPRHLVPGWGAIYLPILSSNNSTFHRGVNYILQSHEGSTITDEDHNLQYINYSGSFSCAPFSTGNFSGSTTIDATYNSTFSYGGGSFAGAKFFVDSRGLGRQGIQLPPFYGVARLFAVYESADYKTNGSGFNSSTREPTGSGATNLLRQNFDGPIFWVEIDDDGDSYFILNADALDLSKSPTPISNFSSKHYVVMASVFGFDRGSFDLDQPFRMVLSRNRTEVNDVTRDANMANLGVHGPWMILPGPMTSSDTALINYSRTPYQGDPWGSQSNYSDIGYAAGPLTSNTAYQLNSSNLDLDSLTRPNQKAIEVLASIGFITTLGSGRLSGDLVASNKFDFRNVGYDDPSVYPPVSSVSSRPNLLMGALDPLGSFFDSEANPEYLGCTERLPLGSLYRDRDFHGGRFTSLNSSPFMYMNNVGLGNSSGAASQTNLSEQTEVGMNIASLSEGVPGDILVQVDGEVGLYELLTNFRVNRGGSMFVASGSLPGGELFCNYDQVQGSGLGTKVVVGRAFLVRNTRTSVGASQVSAGDELMLSVVTRVMTLGTSVEDALVTIGTNGTAEGSAASDLYRIEGHPLIANRVRYEVDPSSIELPNSLGY
jgi:hypothetical protein